MRIEILATPINRYTVQVVEVSPRLLAAARGNGHAQNFIGRLFELLDEVWKFLRANPNIQQAGLNVFLYHGQNGLDLLHSEQGLPIEAGVIVPAPFESSGKVICSATPGGTVATVTHIGPYENLSQAHAAIHDWCRDNDCLLAGPSWELYDHWNNDPKKLRTDVFYLLKRPQP